MVLRPVRLVRVGLVGLKSDREAILSVLHDLGIVQVEPVAPETLRYLAPERTSDEQRTIADELLRFRGLRSALVPVPVASRRAFAHREEVLAAARAVPIDAEVAEAKRAEDAALTRLAAARDELALLDRLAFYPGRLEWLAGPSITSLVGEADAAGIAEVRAIAGPRAAVLEGPVGPSGRRSFLVTLPAEATAELARLAQRREFAFAAVPARDGTVSGRRQELEEQRRAAEAARAAAHGRLCAIAERWYGEVAAIEEALAIEARKLEIYGRLAAGRETFALEGWVPERDLGRLRSALAAATGDRVVLGRRPTAESPPTLMENPRGIRWYEFFVRFYSLPQADEWDPTLVFALVFPIFFGLMLGDWGYGLVILLICLWMIRGFPGAHRLPKFGRNFVKMILGPNAMRQLAYALVPGCAVAIGLGLYWDEFFGYPLFHRLFGYVPAVSPIGNVGLLLLVAGYIGLGMVTLGFAFGALQEYWTGHRRAAGGKVGGILFAWGLAFFGLSVLRHQTSFAGNPLLALYLALLGVGLLLLLALEGIQMGSMGLIEVVSHILSFTRLVGILLASVILALVFNTIAGGQFHAAAPGLLVVGLVVLVVGQSFNTILGVFEPGIQGARLLFVEYFSKFYHGNGRSFRPFGSTRKYTVPAPPPAFASPETAPGPRLP